MSLLFSSSSSLRRCIGPTSPLRSLVSARFNSDGPRRSPLSPEKTQILRDWAEEFQTKELDKELPGVDVRFDRSGGAGGQNVNKVNTKATVRISLAQASPSWIPSPLLPTLTSSSPYYTLTTHSLLLSGSSTRSQSGNLADCFLRLRAHLLALAHPLMPKETSKEKMESVEEMKKKYKEKIRNEKEKRKEKKEGRSAGRGGRGDE
ncbi:hypothetical protein BDY24DRAFT_2749 [Mrakia frigida]|uniref:Pth4p n=1 Tax=Mrakia frigida TaxID=29902 RepID=UPI003FCBFF25